MSVSLVRRFASPSIARRLALSFGLLAVLVGAVGGIGLRTMARLRATEENVAHNRFERVVAAQQGVALINENARRMFELRVTDDRQAFQGLLEKQKETSHQISVLYEKFAADLDTVEERAAFASIVAAREEYLEKRQRTEQVFAGQGDDGRTRKALEQTVLPALTRYVGRWNDLSALERRLADDATQGAKSEYTRARYALWGLIAFAVVLATAIAVSAIRAITAPLGQLLKAARHLERGVPPPRIEVASDDEMTQLAQAFNTMGDAVLFREGRLREEMELARRIQTAMLPRRFGAQGFEITGQMTPADEVGGDYYDVLPSEEAVWLGIGDVSGHGLNTGLIALMIQTAVAALVKKDARAQPSQVLAVLNEVLFDNIRVRLQRQDHATLTLLRCGLDGRVVFAGAHEDILVCRASTGRVEAIETPGPWAGAVEDVRAAARDTALTLEQGDLMVLYTDGVIQARNGGGEMFGLERLSAELQKMRGESLDRIREQLMQTSQQWAPTRADDASLLIARFGVRNG